MSSIVCLNLQRDQVEALLEIQYGHVVVLKKGDRQFNDEGKKRGHRTLIQKDEYSLSLILEMSVQITLHGQSMYPHAGDSEYWGSTATPMHSSILAFGTS
jgi:hypothetical protein